MQRVVGSALALCLVAWPLAAAADLIVPVSQTRTVTASAVAAGGTPSSTSSHAATNFANFNQTASAGFPDPVHNPTGTLPCCRWTSRLGQVSRIEPSRLYADASGSAYYTEIVGVSVRGSASSVYDITFDLTAPSSYFLISFHSSTYFTTHTATLYDAGGAVIKHVAGMSGAAGTLMPGQYRFLVVTALPERSITDSGGYEPYRGWADLTFTLIPEPGTASLLGLGLAMLGAQRRYGRTTASV